MKIARAVNWKYAVESDLDLRDAIISYYSRVPDAVENVIRSVDETLAPSYPMIGLHIDERVLYGTRRDDPTHTLFTTDWASLASDAEITALLRVWAAKAYDSARYFGVLAEEADEMRDRLLAAGATL